MSNSGTILQPPPGEAASTSSTTAEPAEPPSFLAASPGPPGGRKRAVICGVAYKDTRYELKGCINDAKCMKSLLVNRFGFPEDSILMLTEEETETSKHPTKQNIMTALNWLVQGCEPGDSLVFHFSGHGSQRRNETGDELDGYDETLCPLDFETQGMIIDDEINQTVVSPLPSRVKLHAIIDACHSGTVLDLPYLCRMNRDGNYEWEDHRPRSGTWKGTSGGEAICFSGCDDHQTSSDSSVRSEEACSGAMTFSFIQAIERGHGTTYGSLLRAMRFAIADVDGGDDGGCLVTKLISKLLAGGNSGDGLKQEPQLTANKPFDAYTEHFSL